MLESREAYLSLYGRGEMGGALMGRRAGRRNLPTTNNKKSLHHDAGHIVAMPLPTTDRKEDHAQKSWVLYRFRVLLEPAGLITGRQRQSDDDGVGAPSRSDQKHGLK